MLSCGDHCFIFCNSMHPRTIATLKQLDCSKVDADLTCEVISYICRNKPVRHCWCTSKQSTFVEIPVKFIAICMIRMKDMFLIICSECLCILLMYIVFCYEKYLQSSLPLCVLVCDIFLGSCKISMCNSILIGRCNFSICAWLGRN